MQQLDSAQVLDHFIGSHIELQAIYSSSTFRISSCALNVHHLCKHFYLQVDLLRRAASDKWVSFAPWLAPAKSK
jgi:hypothetical protein